MAEVDPVPEDYPRVTPYLHVDGASAAIDFYTQVFGAIERMRMPGEAPDSIGHAELQLGNSVIMLADEFPDVGVLGPRSIGGSPVTLHVYVEDVDATFDKAGQAGARALEQPTDRFYGDRSGQFETRSGTAGTWPPTSRTSHLTRCSAAWRKRPVADDPPMPLVERTVRTRPARHGGDARPIGGDRPAVGSCTIPEG